MKWLVVAVTVAIALAVGGVFLVWDAKRGPECRAWQERVIADRAVAGTDRKVARELDAAADAKNAVLRPLGCSWPSGP